MAVVREMTCESGARVIVRDDCYRDASPEEIKRRRARIWEQMCKIAARAAQDEESQAQALAEIREA